MPKGVNRIELVNSERQPVFGARRIGKPDPKEQIEVSVYLRQSTPTPRAHDIRPPKKPLSRQEFADLHGARPQDIRRIRQFARNHGLTVKQVDPAASHVVLSGPVQAMEKAFGTSLELHEVHGKVFRARRGTLSVNKPIGGIIEDVLGLDTRPQARPHFRILKKASPEGRTLAAAVARHAARRVSSFTGAQVASLYQFPPGTDGSGQCIALIELGGGFSAGDVSNYFKKINVKPPAVVAVSVDHGRNQPTGDPNGPDGEVLLDIEVAGAAAPGAKIAVYFAPNTDRGFVDAIMAAVHDKANKPSVISISWGSAEVNWTEQARRQMSKAFAAAALMHITVLAAAGDDGSSDGENDGVAHVDFPASEPNVLACGGTRLRAKNANNIADETVWNNGPGQGATGGGVSECYALPEYQKSAGVPKSINTQFSGRGVPDIAGVADPATGFSVQVDGQSMVIGGTSAVAPLYAALVARLNQALGRPVGLLHPILYSAAAAAKTFRDITQGNNGGYQAGPKWDACTGWGSIQGTQLLKVLQAGGAAPGKAATEASPEKESAPPGPRRRRMIMRRRRLMMRRRRMMRRERMMEQRQAAAGPRQHPAAGNRAPKGAPAPSRPQHAPPRQQGAAQARPKGAPQRAPAGGPSGMQVNQPVMAPRGGGQPPRPMGQPPRAMNQPPHQMPSAAAAPRPAAPTAQPVPRSGTAPVAGQIPQWALDRMAAAGRSQGGPAAHQPPPQQRPPQGGPARMAPPAPPTRPPQRPTPGSGAKRAASGQRGR